MELSEGSASYMNQHGKTFKSFLLNGDQMAALVNQLSQLLGIDFSTLHSENDWLGFISTQIRQWQNHTDQLKDWYNWTVIRAKATENGLGNLTSAFEGGELDQGEIISQTYKGFYRAAADHIFETNPLLSTFNSQLFEDKISRFRTISSKFEALTKAELYARLAAKIPSFTKEAAQSSEIGILQKAIKSKGKGPSIRKLFDAIPNVLQRLTPCMLMSPISVAQYFDAEDTKFDLVIFDEAPKCQLAKQWGLLPGQRV